MRFTEENLRVIIDCLLSEEDKKYSYDFKEGAIESINRDYDNNEFGIIITPAEYIEECLYDYITIRRNKGEISLEALLQKHFGLEDNLFLNKPLGNGDYWTKAGYNAYNKLTSLLYDLQKVIPTFNPNKLIDNLDELERIEYY